MFCIVQCKIKKLHFIPLLKQEKRQRSGIDTIKYHTWPRIPHGKVTKTQFNIANNSQEVSPFLSQQVTTRLQWSDGKYDKHKSWITQMIHKRSTALERSVKLFYLRALTSFTAPTSLLILMWTRTHLAKRQNTTNTTAKKSALSQQVTTRLPGTDTTARHTPTWNITNKNDPQKKHQTFTGLLKQDSWRQPHSLFRCE